MPSSFHRLKCAIHAKRIQRVHQDHGRAALGQVILALDNSQCEPLGLQVQPRALDGAADEALGACRKQGDE